MKQTAVLLNPCHHQGLLRCFLRSLETGSTDASVEVVIASQSFHWFANSTALDEIHRVLVPHGSFGMIWALPDFSLPWLAKLEKFLAPLFKEKSIVLPPDEQWKSVFSLTPRKLFSDLEENLNFRLNFPSSFARALRRTTMTMQTRTQTSKCQVSVIGLKRDVHLV